MLIGDYALLKGAVTCRKLRRAKKVVLKSLFKEMKRLARERPGFFIIHSEVRGENVVATVALKIELPTVGQEYDESVV